MTKTTAISSGLDGLQMLQGLMRSGGSVTDIKFVGQPSAEQEVPLAHSRLVDGTGLCEFRPVQPELPGVGRIFGGSVPACRQLQNLLREFGGGAPGEAVSSTAAELDAERALDELMMSHLASPLDEGTGPQIDPEVVVGGQFMVGSAIANDLAVRMSKTSLGFDRVYLPEMTLVTVITRHDNWLMGDAFQLRVDSQAASLVDGIPEEHIVPEIGDVIEVGVTSFLGATGDRVD